MRSCLLNRSFPSSSSRIWLVPLTMIPQWFMGAGGTTPLFGPDTSTGLLPIPHVLAYYAIFFGFGALYYGYDDPSDRVGARWWLPLAIGLLVVFPLGLALTGGWPGPPGLGPGTLPHRVLSVFLQAAYPWLMTFGLMGLFRRAWPVESPTMRYLSDSAYWLYLAHLPLVVFLVGALGPVRWPAFVKFTLVLTVTTGSLLVVYHYWVREGRIGERLNGRRLPRVWPPLPRRFKTAASRE